MEINQYFFPSLFFLKLFLLSSAPPSLCRPPGGADRGQEAEQEGEVGVPD